MTTTITTNQKLERDNYINPQLWRAFININSKTSGVEDLEHARLNDFVAYLINDINDIEKEVKA